ncbi:MAG: hypothetical protein ACLQCU_10500 [Acidimicrobiales bacterium]|jgi:hypothetical protein
MYMLQLAEEHRADATTAAERGRLVREVRDSRQHHAGGLWITAAVRDLSRRLWDGALVHSPRRDLGVAEAAAVHVAHSWDLARSGGLPIAIDPTAVDLGLATSQMAVSPESRR